MNITKLIPQPRHKGKYASKKQRLHNWIGYTATVAFTIFYVYNIISGFTHAQPVEAVMLSPVPTMPPGVTSQQQVKSNPMEEEIPTSTPSPAPGGAANEEVRQLIIEVFGEHADKAFLLLQGDGTPGACAENRALNPEAVNDNREWGGVGRDWGVFQINDHWQGFRHEGKAIQFLTDPEINVRVAWRIFEDNGYSFSRWTCGRHYGI